MLASTANYEITWEKLLDDFVLDDEPVDNIGGGIEFGKLLLWGLE